MHIRSLTPSDLDDFLTYLNDHLLDNGRDGRPLFQPMPRGQGFPPEKAAGFRNGAQAPLGQPGWRRVWVVENAHGIMGHIDLRSRPEAAAAHRALLGMGVHRDARRGGIGLQLLDTAIAWATRQGLEWIDLEVLSANAPALALYRKRGFVQTGEIPDLFRIDGESLAYRYMSLALQAPQREPV
jgi:ribosomal protein S18 acetylase RimI-like enzyme